MVHICDRRFKARKYFRQHELPPGSPNNHPYEYSRALVIRLEPEVDNGKLAKLNPTLQELVVGEIMLGDPPGIPKGTRAWEDVAADLLDPSLTRNTNPIDFQLWNISRIIFSLEGDFWRFSSSLAPLTTKHNYRGQYFDLRRHFMTPVGPKSLTEEQWKRWLEQWPDQTCHCISFYTKKPCRERPNPKNNVKHGFSLNIELLFLDEQGLPVPDKMLPITFDPDIENKGGHSL